MDENSHVAEHSTCNEVIKQDKTLVQTISNTWYNEHELSSIQFIL